MTRHLLLVFCFIALLHSTTYAQTKEAGGFGGFYGYENPTEQQMTEPQLKAISETIKNNVQDLRRRGIIKEHRETADTVRFGWPLRQAAGFTDPSYFGISNYLDWNTAANVVGDFNCGTRTYDGHRGTDMYTFPYGWKKKDENAVEIIAAADGVIVAKYDGYADTSCANCNPSLPTCQWNALFVKSNVDGTIVWYGHMKKNSITSKVIGNAVSKGEYLGVVGSSGNSTGPHLHFEVWLNDNYNFLIDPWSGACNLDHTGSFWQSQEPYYAPQIIKISTASGVPQFSQCYNGGLGEKPLYKDVFAMNETLYFPVYVRDNIPGKQFNFRWISPTGVVKLQQNPSSFNTYFSSAYLYYFYPGSNFNEVGKWKLRVTYENSVQEHEFTMTAPLPLNLLTFAGEKQGKTALLTWRTSREDQVDKFEIEKSKDGVLYQSIGTVKAIGSLTTINEYSFTDLLPQNGDNFYRLKMLDKDAKFTNSSIVKLNVQGAAADIVLLTNPAGSELRFVTDNDYAKAGIRILDHLGKTVVLKTQKLLRNQQTVINIANLARGNYYLVVDTESKRLTRSFIKQ